MKKRSPYRSVALVALFVASVASAQAWRGMGRLQGIVTDAGGKPLEGAKVILVWAREGNSGGPEPILTNARGRWVAGGLGSGKWNIDVTAEGFLTRQISANVSELQRLQPEMKVVLEPKPVQKAPPPEEAKETIQVGGVEISPEIATAIDAANNFMKEQKWKEAAAEYEKAIVALPANVQLKAALSRAYYGAGDLKKALMHLQEVYASDTGNAIYATLLADLLLESGDLAGGQKILATIPPGALSDPNTIINLGIRFINSNKPEDAHKYFNDAVAVAPDMAAAYYYRGVASIQLKKMKEAKADFQKVVAMAPDSSEANDAKELLAQMK